MFQRGAVFLSAGCVVFSSAARVTLGQAIVASSTTSVNTR
jgi:hypothetical protein